MLNDYFTAQSQPIILFIEFPKLKGKFIEEYRKTHSKLIQHYEHLDFSFDFTLRVKFILFIVNSNLVAF